MRHDVASRRIISLVNRIPRGRVATYGQIAALAGKPRHARQVGAILRSLPEDSKVPWHRVVNARGRISVRRNSASESFQRVLLRSESVELDDAGRVDLNVFKWGTAGPADAVQWS